MLIEAIKKEILNIKSSLDNLLNLLEGIQNANEISGNLKEFNDNIIMPFIKDIEYLKKSIKAEGTLYLNRVDRYAINDEVYFKLGDTIEILLEDEKSNSKIWIVSTIEHNGRDYYIKSKPELKLNGLYARYRE